MNTYKTIDVARIFGIHVNTVRLYKKYELIPKPERRSNGYRIFTDIHIEQFSLARAALQVEVLQNGLRKLAVDMIKVSASGDYDEAAELAKRYIAKVDVERENAEEAIEITRNWELNGLFTVRRLENGYRVYTEKDLQRLKIIQSLRCANYSLSSILRMLQAIFAAPDIDIHEAIDTPGEDDDIITACDKLLKC